MEERVKLNYDHPSSFDTDKMISNDYKTKISINKKEMADCIDRATLLIKEGEKNRYFYLLKILKWNFPLIHLLDQWMKIFQYQKQEMIC